MKIKLAYTVLALIALGAYSFVSVPNCQKQGEEVAARKARKVYVLDSAPIGQGNPFRL